MDPAQALIDLMEISSQVEAAVLFDETGAVAASTLPDEERSRELVRLSRELVGAADGIRRDGGPRLTQVQAATGRGSVFVLREGSSFVAATTAPDPTVGLVFYDLKSCLRSMEARQA